MSKPPESSKRDQLYAEAVSQFGSALGRLVAGYEANPERQRDLLQEIHIALWSSLENFNGACSLRTWIYRIGHNAAINHVIKSKRHERPTLGLEELDARADESNVEEMLDAAAVMTRLKAMIQSLTPSDRQIILLYLDDVDAATIAEITGMSAGHVATKIHRIKRVLARNFNQRADYERMS